MLVLVPTKERESTRKMKTNSECTYRAVFIPPYEIDMNRGSPVCRFQLFGALRFSDALQ